MPIGEEQKPKLALLDAQACPSGTVVTGTVWGFPGGDLACQIWGTFASSTVTVYGTLDSGNSATTLTAISGLSSTAAELIQKANLPPMWMAAVINNSGASATASISVWVTPA